MNERLLHETVHEKRIIWHKHAFERMMERGLSRNAVIITLLNGQKLEDYPHDRPLPSALYFCMVMGESVHVVAALDENERNCHVITAYRPDTDHFEDDFKTRKTP
tara:strand:- start:200 stop:514 length:315 start_codon:yes stop_codon:yes gene_type:complete